MSEEKHQHIHSDDLPIKSPRKDKSRGKWGGKLEFIFSCLSYAVGLGNLWRFPYLCYSNGGGAFLIPYIIMLIFAGIPLFFMEMAFGQYGSEGVISIWRASPLFMGIGWGMFAVSVFIGTYYNMVIAWTLFYFFASLNSDVPWRGCQNTWNSPACSLMATAAAKNCSKFNGTFYNKTCYTVAEYGLEMYNSVVNISNHTTVKRKSPSDEYFHNYVLDISDGFHDMGEIRWQLALCLLGAWVIVGLCLIRGIKSSGKAVYFTALFPYLVLLVLLVRGLTLPGSVNGIIYYLTPEWHNLARAKVWGDAAVQIFFSLSPCWGGLIVLASYNKFNNNCFRDALIVSIGNCCTSVFAGFVIFSIIGYMAYELEVDIKDVADKGAGLAFIVYPEVVARLPASPFWAAIFFMMMVTLGMGTQFATVNTIHTTLLDLFPRQLRRKRRSMLTLLVICCTLYLLGLSCCSRGGMYMLQLMDNYSGTYSVLIVGWTECVVLAWVYGADRFLSDIKLMIGYSPGIWWKIMWKYVTPLLLIFILVFTWYDFKPSSYGDYVFPAWADVLGWLMSFTSPIMIPVVMIVQVWRAKRKPKYAHFTLWETIKDLAKSTPEWEAGGHNRRKSDTGDIQIMTESQTPLTKNRIEMNETNSQDLTVPLKVESR